MDTAELARELDGIIIGFSLIVIGFAVVIIVGGILEFFAKRKEDVRIIKSLIEDDIRQYIPFEEIRVQSKFTKRHASKTVARMIRKGLLETRGLWDIKLRTQDT